MQKKKVAHDFRYDPRSFVHSSPQFPKENCFSEGSKTSPVSPSGRSNIEMKMSVEQWYWQRKNAVLGAELVLKPLFTPQISHGPTGDRTHSSAVSGRRLAVWAVAQFFKTKIKLYNIWRFSACFTENSVYLQSVNAVAVYCCKRTEHLNTRCGSF